MMTHFRGQWKRGGIKKEKKSLWKLPGPGETKSFPTAVSSGFTRRVPPAPAPLRPEFTREPETLQPAAEDSGVRDGPGVGWCGAVAPQTACFPSVLAPVPSWPRLSPRVPGSVLGPSPSEDSSRIRGMAVPPRPRRGEPGWWSAKCRPLATPPQHTFSARGFGVFGFLPSQRGRGFRAHAVLALWSHSGRGPEDTVGSWPGPGG